MEGVTLFLLVLCGCAGVAPAAPVLAAKSAAAPVPALATGLLPADQEQLPLALTFTHGNGTTPATASTPTRDKKSAPGTCITINEPGQPPLTLCNDPSSSPGLAPGTQAPKEPATTSEARTFGLLHHGEHSNKKIQFVEVPVVKHLKVPVVMHGYDEHMYGGHRASAAVSGWPQPNSAAAFAPFGAPSFDPFRAADAEQEALVAAAIDAELALQAHLVNRHAQEQARHVQEQQMDQLMDEQARRVQVQEISQQELQQARHAEGAEWSMAPDAIQQMEQARQAQLEMEQAMRHQAHMINQQAFAAARQAQLERLMEESARSALLGPSYSPLPPINNFLPRIPNVAATAGVFPHGVAGGGCGALPLLFSCSPQLVRGHLAPAANGGGGDYYQAAAPWASGGGGVALHTGGGAAYRQSEEHAAPVHVSAVPSFIKESKTEPAAGGGHGDHESGASTPAQKATARMESQGIQGGNWSSSPL